MTRDAVIPVDFSRGLEKHWEVPTVTPEGYRTMIALELQKHASLGVTDDEARALSPETAKFVNKLANDDPNSTYQIVIPIGIGDSWGINFRGDLVYRDQMIPDVNSEAYRNRPYGYPTFKSGHFFAHHRNKPAKGHPILGDVPFVTLNPKMQWIELVVRAHLPSVEEHHPELLSQIISGAFPVSMGLLAIADVCLKCGNVRKGPTSRPCKHIMPPSRGGELGKIYKDGSVAGMSNIQPRFFDISFVNRGADSIGFSLKKVADAEPARDEQEMITIRRALNTMKQKGVLEKIKKIPKKDDPGELEKFSKIKKALAALAREEPDIDPTALMKQAKAGGLGLLDAMAMSGILLRPHEFQTAYLGATHPARAGELLLAKRTFPMTPADLTAMPSMTDLPFRVTPSGVKLWVGQNLSPWKSWDAQMLIHRMLAPQPVVQSVVPAQAWTPDLNDATLKVEYLKHLTKALSALIEKAASYSGPEGMEYVSDPDALEVQKQAGLGALATVLPAMYFAKLLGADISAGAAPGIGASQDLTGSGTKAERSVLQKLLMFNPFLATSFAGVAGKGGAAVVNKLDDLLLRRLIKA